MPQTATKPLPQANVRNAREPFPKDKYFKVPNVAIFTEHETTGPNGTPQVFDRASLENLIRNGNDRIRQTGDYAAVTVGHTVDPEEGDSTQPEVIGHMGPFRLGMLGSGAKRQKYAILADLWIRRDKVETYNACPRRSVELWYRHDEPQFIDPLSLLSETPRLDLGLAPMIDAKGSDGAEGGMKYLYSAIHGGFKVVKYAAAAPAFSSSANVFTPSDTYSAQRSHRMLSPEEVQQIVDAVSELDVFVAMEQIAPLLPKLQEMVAGQDENLAATNELPNQPSDLAEPGEGENPAEHEALEAPATEAAEEGALPPPDAGAEPPAAPAEPPAEEPEPEKYSLDESSSDEDVAKYMAWRKTRAAKSCYNADQCASPGTPKKMDITSTERQPDRYSKLQEELNILKAERAERADEARATRLQQLRQLRVFDYDAEMERCRYSKMSDSEFKARIQEIGDNYRTTGVTAEMPIPEQILGPATTATPHATSVDRYTKAVKDQAVRYCTDQAAKGLEANYAVVLDNIANNRPPEFTGAPRK